MKKIVLSLILSMGFYYCAFSQTNPPDTIPHRDTTKSPVADTPKTKLPVTDTSKMKPSVTDTSKIKPSITDTSKAKTAPVAAPVVPVKKVSKGKMSFGVDTGLPIGQAGTFYSVIFGASAKLELPLRKSHFNFIVTTGFDSFSVKGTYNTTLNNANYIPLEAGARYFFNKIFYAEGDVGASFVTSSNYSGPGAAFVFSPAIGLIPTTDKSEGGMDISLRYESRVENSSSISQIALRIAVSFGW
jgi:hypothetical protein